MESEIYFKEESYRIQGAVFEVYREMGAGFLEAVYQECLANEFVRQEIPFVAHPNLRIFYKGKPLGQSYVPDFICNESIVVELKAPSATSSDHRAQLMNYLRATKLRLGLLVNFGSHPKATVERIVL